MKFGAASYSISIVLAGLLGCGSSVTSAQTQPPPPERPVLRDFGSSLRRLKWDEQKKAAVETQAKRSDEQEGDSDEEVVRIETSLVVCDVLVLDAKGRPVQGLTPGDFVVNEDGRPQHISTFSLGDGVTVPRTVVLIIDYSRSQLPFIKSSVEAAKALVDKLGPRDRMAVVTDDVELLAGFTGDKNELRSRLESLGERATSGRRLGRSAQYSALMATLREAFDEEDLRPIVIFQTDGDELNLLRDSPNRPPSLRPGMSPEAQEGLSRVIQSFRDNMREFSLGDVFKSAERSRATIYTIIPGFRFIGLTPDEQVKQATAYLEKSISALDEMKGKRPASRPQPQPLRAAPSEQALNMQTALAEMANLTGGWADFLEEPSQAGRIYERILSDMNRRYVIGYYPTNKARDGKRRRVSIEVRGHPEYLVKGRRSYYAPDPDE
jgi:VWFA-related protein